MPCDKVNHIRLELEYAVPTPSLELEVQRGGIPGLPKATLPAPDVLSPTSPPRISRVLCSLRLE